MAPVLTVFWRPVSWLVNVTDAAGNLGNGAHYAVGDDAVAAQAILDGERVEVVHKRPVGFERTVLKDERQIIEPVGAR